MGPYHVLLAPGDEVIEPSHEVGVKLLEIGTCHEMLPRALNTTQRTCESRSKSAEFFINSAFRRTAHSHIRHIRSIEHQRADSIFDVRDNNPAAAS
jgi:hypothetical protein